MSADRFHKAAKDGLLDVLKEATRKDANAKDDDGMTPVLWAAFEGRLDALRLLCGRGGDPDKCDQFGNTALHLASAKGHLSSVVFLIKFGVNIYALDIDKHNAKDLAAINSRDDILRYLDTATAALESNDKKKSRALKDAAEKNYEKKIREYMKRQQKLENESNSLKPLGASQKSSNVLSAIKHKFWSSQGNLSNKSTREHSNSPNTPKFSDLIGSGGGACSVAGSISSRAGVIPKKSITSKFRTHSLTVDERMDDIGFKIGGIGETECKRTITSLTGLQKSGISEVLYVGTFSSNEDIGKRGKISDVFELDEASSDAERETIKSYYGTLARSFSQPDILADRETDNKYPNEMGMQPRAGGLFERPMLGSIAFRRSVTAALSQIHPEACSIDGSYASTLNTTCKTTKPRTGKSRTFLNISDSDSDGGGYSDDDDQDLGNPIQRFLVVWGLEEYLTVFQKQQIDLDTLMLLTEADIKTLGLPLGPFRKLTFAIQERRNALANPGVLQDTHL